MPELTKDADKLICCLYREYLEKRKSGISKADAKEFEGNFYKNVKVLSNWNSSDVSETLQELHGKKLLKKNVLGDFSLNDEAIIYMENRFKNGLNEVMDFISNLPLMP